MDLNWVSFPSVTARCLKGSRQREIQDRARPHWQGQGTFLHHYPYCQVREQKTLLRLTVPTHLALHIC